jgi:CheY-like chemotaxis protein
MEELSSKSAVLALTADLMFAARVRSTAEAVGTPILLAKNAAEVLQLARAHSPREIIIDLDARNTDVIKLIAELKQEPAISRIPILAYVSHVREDLIAAARDAGAERVLARGAFVKQLPALLAG